MTDVGYIADGPLAGERRAVSPAPFSEFMVKGSHGRVRYARRAVVLLGQEGAQLISFWSQGAPVEALQNASDEEGAHSIRGALTCIGGDVA